MSEICDKCKQDSDVHTYYINSTISINVCNKDNLDFQLWLTENANAELLMVCRDEIYLLGLNYHLQPTAELKDQYLNRCVRARDLSIRLTKDVINWLRQENN